MLAKNHLISIFSLISKVIITGLPAKQSDFEKNSVRREKKNLQKHLRKENRTKKLSHATHI